MEHIRFSFQLLKQGIDIIGWDWTKELPTEEGTYIIGVNDKREIDTLELISYTRYDSKAKKVRHALGYVDYDGEIVYLEDGCDFDWMIRA